MITKLRRLKSTEPSIRRRSIDTKREKVRN